MTNFCHEKLRYMERGVKRRTARVWTEDHPFLKEAREAELTASIAPSNRLEERRRKQALRNRAAQFEVGDHVFAAGICVGRVREVTGQSIYVKNSRGLVRPYHVSALDPPETRPA